MTTYRQFGLRVFIWSVFLFLGLTYFTDALNPFLGSVCSLLLLMAVVVQLVLLRRKGLAYIGIFLLCLIVLTSAFMYVGNRTLDHPRRYYSIH